MDNREVIVITSICAAVLILITAMMFAGGNPWPTAAAGISNPVFPLTSINAAKAAQKSRFL